MAIVQIPGLYIKKLNIQKEIYNEMKFQLFLLYIVNLFYFYRLRIALNALDRV